MSPSLIALGGVFSLRQASRLTGGDGTCIHWRMTKVLTIRLDPELLGRAEARAARLGLDRAKYVRSLIEEDLARGSGESRRKFASEDLAGSYEGSGRSASNMEARERLRKRAGRGA